MGSSNDDNPSRVMVDDNFDVYVVGFTNGSNFPTTPGAYDITHNGNYDAFVTKINSTGTALIYSTFVGGPGNDQNWSSLHVNATGEAYIAGRAATGFPVTTGAFNSIYSGGTSDAFIAKLNSAGSSLLFSTFYGGSAIDEIFNIDLNSSGEIFVTGQTSGSIPMTSCSFDNTPNGGNDAFVAKFNPDASALIYATYLGGSSGERGASIAADGNMAYVLGETASANFPVTSGAFDETYNGGTNDIFVVKIELSGTTISAGFTANDVCIGDSTYFTNSSQGGTQFNWDFGDGNTSSLMNPVHLYTGPGSYNVVLVVSDSCGTDTLIQAITVHPLPTVTLSSFSNVDITTAPFALTGGSPVGGTYSGPGVTNNIFDPSSAGLGTHTIVYSFTDSVGCSGSDSATITVTQTIVVILDPFAHVCIDSTPFALTGGSPPGGMYAGPGVSNGIFDPSMAGVGTHVIVYTFNNLSDTSTITIHALPTVTLSPFANVDITTAPFALTGGSPVGGTYSGPGVANNIFDPSAAGLGTHTIIYNYTDSNGCSNSASAAITVTQPVTVTLDPFADVCLDATSFALTGGLPAGGTYSGPGVVNGIFDPSVAGQGTHTITYSFAGQTATQTITVNPLPVVTVATSGGTTGCDSTVIIGVGSQTIITATSATAVSYQWYHNGNLISGANSATLNVTQGGTYTAVVTDANGCMSDPNAPGASVNINGITANCGNNNNKVILCHYPPGNNGNPQTLCIAPSAVPAHLANHPGDCLGPCPGQKISPPATIVEDLHYHISPNPVTDKAEISFMVFEKGNVKIEMLDLLGRSIKNIYNNYTEADKESTVEFDVSGLTQGVYLIRIQSPDGVVTEKVTVVR